MTGAELLAQVREDYKWAYQYPWVTLPLDALDGCVLLTREEAERISAFIGWMPSPETQHELEALLTPEQPK